MGTTTGTSTNEKRPKHWQQASQRLAHKAWLLSDIEAHTLYFKPFFVFSILSGVLL